jgi:DNA-directed RNA polymerase subunit beta'
MIESTLGRIIFNEVIPQDIGYVDRSKPENRFRLECDFLAGKKELGQIIERCIRTHGITETANTLDKIKALGYRYSTRGGISIGIFD